MSTWGQSHQCKNENKLLKCVIMTRYRKRIICYKLCNSISKDRYYFYFNILILLLIMCHFEITHSFKLDLYSLLKWVQLSVWTPVWGGAAEPSAGWDRLLFQIMSLSNEHTTCHKQKRLSASSHCLYVFRSFANLLMMSEETGQTSQRRPVILVEDDRKATQSPVSTGSNKVCRAASLMGSSSSRATGGKLKPQFKENHYKDLMKRKTWY